MFVKTPTGWVNTDLIMRIDIVHTPDGYIVRGFFINGQTESLSEVFNSETEAKRFIENITWYNLEDIYEVLDKIRDDVYEIREKKCFNY